MSAKRFPTDRASSALCLCDVMRRTFIDMAVNVLGLCVVYVCVCVCNDECDYNYPRAAAAARKGSKEPREQRTLTLVVGFWGVVSCVVVVNSNKSPTCHSSFTFAAFAAHRNTRTRRRRTRCCIRAPKSRNENGPRAAKPK